jgi:hypothetical protein
MQRVFKWLGEQLVYSTLSTLFFGLGAIVLGVGLGVAAYFLFVEKDPPAAAPRDTFMRHLRLMDAGAYEDAWMLTDGTCPKLDRFMKAQFKDIKQRLAEQHSTFTVEFAPVEVYVEAKGEKALLRLKPAFFADLQWQPMVKVDGKWRLSCEF